MEKVHWLLILKIFDIPGRSMTIRLGVLVLWNSEIISLVSWPNSREVIPIRGLTHHVSNQIFSFHPYLDGIFSEKN